MELTQLQNFLWSVEVNGGRLVLQSGNQQASLVLTDLTELIDFAETILDLTDHPTQ